MMRRVAFMMAVMALSVVTPASSGAQGPPDFWAEVRTPGLRAWRAHMGTATTALRERRFQLAERKATLAIGILPERAAGYVARARARSNLGQIEAATADYRAALARDPEALTDPQVGALAASTFAEAGESTAALEVLERVLGRMENTGPRAELYALYGDLLLAVGPPRLAAAILAYREVLRASAAPHPRAQIGLALALHRNGETAAAETHANQATASANRRRLSALIQSLPIPASEKSAREAMAAQARANRSGTL